jgi:ATP-dependent RNA helicase DDX59
MAANFHFVPRSVNIKPSKTKQISREKLQHLQNSSNNIQGCNLSALNGHNGESNSKNVSQTSAHTSCGIGKSSESSVPFVSGICSQENEGESDEDSSDIVYFSKNQRWPEEGEPICVVCGRYGEFICDQTDADVCSKECKAKNLQLRQAGKKQQQEEDFKTCGSSDDQSNSKAIFTENNRKATLGDTLMTPQETEVYQYIVHPQIASLTEEQVHQLRCRIEISIRGDNDERPIFEFAQCGLSEQLSENLKKCGYVTPTPVQMQVIPVALAGRDLLACAQTGSGKTAAFLVPMITKIHYKIGK